MHDPERMIIYAVQEPRTQAPVGTRTSGTAKCKTKNAAYNSAVGTAEYCKAIIRPCFRSKIGRYMENNSWLGYRDRGRAARYIGRCAYSRSFDSSDARVIARWQCRASQQRIFSHSRLLSANKPREDPPHPTCKGYRIRSCFRRLCRAQSN